MMMYRQHIMRTTIDIPDHLLAEAKQLAAERHLPLTRLVEDSLRLYLGEQRLRRAQAEPAPLPLLRGPVPVAGVDLDDASRLWELG
jgi:Arc/MetJ family transcription regulator